MTDDHALLIALQHGDSFFPSGAVSFSWGIETLVADGRITNAEDVGRFIAAQLTGRWATSDRPVLIAAHAATGDLGAIAHADALLEASALLNVHTRLGTDGAAGYQALVRQGAAPGHAPAVQGLIGRAVDLDVDAACLVAAHGLCVGLLGAALRLGVTGHVDSQRLLARLHETITAIAAEPAPALDALHAYAPAGDIAMMRHETQTSRLFAN
jgi:urease accessory protein